MSWLAYIQQTRGKKATFFQVKQRKHFLSFEMLRIQTTFMLIFSIGNRALKIDPEKYVPFLSDIQEYYKSSGIFFIWDNSMDRFELSQTLGTFFAEFSRRGVYVQTIRYSRLETKSDFYLSHNVQALFTVFLESRSNYENFCAATENHDMSYHTWLVIFTDEKMEKICSNPKGNPFHLVFNSRMIVFCNGDDVIRKWYAIFKDKTEVLELARWSKELGISYKNKDYYSQRYDLAGAKLKIATQTNKTTLMNSKMTGIFVEILNELQNFMNFVAIKVYQDDAYGTYIKETDKWTGLIGLLTEEKVDLVVAPITISKMRLDYIHFTVPLLLSKNRIYVKQPAGARVQWSAYFRAFSIESWSSIACLLLMASILTALIRLRIREKKFSKFTINYFLENFMYIWGIYCQQGIPEFPTATPLRLAYFSILLLTLVIWAIYSASVTSYLTFLSPSLPFSDTEGFIKDGTYRLIVLQNSSDHQIIMSGSDPVLSQLQTLLYSPDDLPTNPFDGFQKVCEKKVGFYTSEDTLKGVSGYIPCPLAYIETGQFECLAIAMTKHSPYVTSINYNLRKLEDNGVLKKLKNWYFHEIDQIVETTHSPIGIWGVAPLLAIFASGFMLSILFLVIEYIYSFHRRKA